MIVHQFYRDHDLRLHEIPKGVKCPVATGWPNTAKRADDVEPLLDCVRFDKYGWILDDCHVVIDIDVHDGAANGFDSLAKLESEMGFSLADVCGAIVDTPSGGRHYYFSKPDGVKFGKVFRDRYPGIDFINGRGKQVVAANSYHDAHPGTYRMSGDGHLVEIPDKLIDHLCGISKKPKPRAEQAAPAFELTEQAERSGDEFNKSPKGVELVKSVMESMRYVFRSAGDYWEFDRPDKTTDSERSGYLGKRSQTGNYQLTSFTLSDPNFPSGESMTIFHTYAKLAHGGDHTEAADELYRLGYAKDPNNFGLDHFAEFLASFEPDESELEIGRKVEDPGEFPADCLLPPGFIADVARHTTSTADEPQPILSLGGAMCLLSVLTGRKIRNARDNRTNLFVLGLGPSGCGKDHPRKVNLDILSEIGRFDLCGPNALGSGHGIESQLREHPAKLFQLDEIGDLLKSIKKEKNGGYMESILGKIKMLMTSAHTTYSNGATADAKKLFTINQPHLVIFGTATAEKFWDNLTIDSVDDGFLGRILPLEVHGYGETQECEWRETPQAIIDQARAWSEFDPGSGENLASVNPRPVVYRMSDEAMARHRRYCQDIDSRIPKDGSHKQTDGLWKRARGRAASLALLLAASRQGPTADGTVEIVDVNLSIKIINWITRRTIFKVHTEVSENQFQRDTNRVLGIIDKWSPDRSTLTNKTPWLRRKERVEIIEHLLERGSIVQDEVKTKTNTKIIFRTR
jgi:hypothetical protein